MSDFLPISIFPEGSLSGSVITTVWVGIWIVCFFNLRLGWVFSGLVIPGYLVPLILVRPFSAGVIVIEALITYALVWLFSETSPSFRRWSSLFGRDRFFALVLTSIAVRLVSEAWAVPKLALWMRENIEGVSILESDLSGYGLIVTSLIANQLWKPGFKRGILPFFVCTFLTWVVVRWGLMETTNFSISNLAFMYEDIAASLEAAPKAYVVLIVAAFIASRLNLKYGWEFNGILIPSLLALQWYQPMKIVTTFVECFFIYGLSCMALRLPVLRDLNMEGARKFLVFFNVGFFYKMALGHGLAILVPTFKSSDAFGFGYMLSTLLAVKMHDKGILLKMTRSTLQASLQAVIWASLLGYGLALAVRWYSPPPVEHFQESITAESDTTLDSVMREHKLSLQRLRQPDSITAPGPVEREAFSKLIRHLLASPSLATVYHQEEILRLAKLCHYKVSWLKNEGILALEEHEPRKGWGTYLFRSEPRNGPVIQVPAPLTEWSTVEAGTALFHHLNGASLALSGSGRQVNRDGSSDMLHVNDSLFSIFNRLCGTGGTLQVRGLGEAYLKREKGLRFTDESDKDTQSSELLVHGAFPKGLRLQKLSDLLFDLKLRWDHTNDSQLPREVSPLAQGELFLSRSDRRRLLYLQTARHQWHDQEGPQMIAGFLTERLLDEREGILSKGSEAYQAPSLEEMLYFDEEVLTPLAETVRSLATGGDRSDGEASLRAVHASARALGYGLTLYRHAMSREEYIILAETDDKRRGWGTLVLRVGSSNPYILEVPRPIIESYTLETGTRLFQRLRCEALIVAGTHALANADRSSDPLSRATNHPLSLFQQVLLREAGQSGRTAIQLRGLSGDRLDGDLSIIMASHLGWLQSEQVSERAKQWMDSLRKDGLPVSLWNGDPLELGGNPWNVPQARYLRATINQDFWQLWLPPEVRGLFRRRDQLDFTTKTFRSIGIATSERYVLEDIASRGRVPPQESLFKVQREAIDTFIDTGQILYLWELMRDHPELQIERWIDLDTKGAFLVAMNDKAHLNWMARIGALSNQVSDLPPKGDLSKAMDVLGGVERWLVPRESLP